MRLLYPAQHQVCRHYGKGGSPFSVIERGHGTNIQPGGMFTPVNELYFIMEGKFTISFDNERIIR